MSRRYLKRMAPSASSDGVTERSQPKHNVKSRHLLPGDGITYPDEARKLGQRMSKPRGAGLLNAIAARMGGLGGANNGAVAAGVNELIESGLAGELSHISWKPPPPGESWQPRVLGDLLAPGSFSPYQEYDELCALSQFWVNHFQPFGEKGWYRPVRSANAVIQLTRHLNSDDDFDLHEVTRPDGRPYPFGKTWHHPAFDRAVDSHLVISCLPDNVSELNKLGAKPSKVCLPSAEDLLVQAALRGAVLFHIDMRMFCPQLPLLYAFPTQYKIEVCMYKPMSRSDNEEADPKSVAGMDCLYVHAGVHKEDGSYYSPLEFQALAEDVVFFRKQGHDDPWHQHQTEIFYSFGDFFASQHRSTQIGYSTGVGGSPRQMEASSKGVGYSLKSMLDVDVMHRFECRWVPFIQDVWRHCERLWPDVALEMLRQLDVSYRLAEGVAWARMSTYLDCCPGHIDQGNFAIAAVFAADVSRAPSLKAARGDQLDGGGQVLMSGTLHRGVYIIEGPWGVLYVGPYNRVLHASFAVRRGARLMISLYFPRSLRGKPARPRDL